MQSKDYQKRVLKNLQNYLQTLADARKKHDAILRQIPDEAARIAVAQNMDFTAQAWNAAKMKKRINCIGDSKEYAAIYLFYQPDVEKLKNLSLTLEQARKLPSAAKGGRRLVFAPAKFVNDAELRKLRIDFCRLPFEIYKMKG